MPTHILTAATATTGLQKFGIRALGLVGWHVAYKPLPGPRGVVIVYPHTSNWDFVYGLLAKWAIGEPFRWLGKQALFRYGLGPFMRAVGGEPVDRSGSAGAISRLAKRIREADHYWLALTPEGTRSYKPTWRSGFYHLALEAGVPLAIVRMDYAAKEVRFTEYLTLTGDLETDLAAIRTAYEGCVGYTPANAGPIVFAKQEKTAAEAAVSGKPE